MDFHAIRIIAAQELIIHIRNKWILLFAGVFAALALAISYFGMVTVGATGFQGFTRTSASLLNLVLYLIPMIALSMGALSFSSEKGEMLFSQPVSRTEVLLGKLAGDFLSMTVATLLGFGLAGMVIAANAGSDGASRYPFFVLFALLLSLIFLSISALVSIACHRKAKAFAVGLFVWFFFVLFYDLIIIGITFVLKEHTANQVLFYSLFGNPVDMVRVGTLILLDGQQIFGAAGAALMKFLGGKFSAVLLLTAALSLWIVTPILITKNLLRRQDI